ncbi:hypothetical protein E4T50_15911 [Aureobasidium sp. EXF-12298]|nr:hypothetical protein E4T50_15911 [Aureobasidium sp. EXF-12298]
MSGMNMNKFVRERNPVDTDDHHIPPPLDRPATAQTTRNVVEHNGYHTDTDGFDDTRSSLGENDHAASDDFQNAEGYDAYGDQADQGHYETDHPAPAELDHLMSQMQKNAAHSGYTNPNSYPSTTEGEPDQTDYSENEVEPDHPQTPSRAKHMTGDSQRNVASTPLVSQTQPPHAPLSKNAFKVVPNPTILPRDVQHQKKSRNKTQVLPRPVPKHALEQLPTSSQAATMHQAAAIVTIEQPGQAHRQPARGQIITADHRQKYTNEAGGHHQQYTRGVHPQEQYVNGVHPQQHNGVHLQQHNGVHPQQHNAVHHRQHNGPHQPQQGVEDLSEEDYEQDTYPEDLDYEPDELYAKDFDDLQREPFDGAPREDIHDAPSDPSSKPLEERLSAFTELDTHRQKELFASLDIEQWEEAGDWFQKRFSDIFDKLKAARRNRRELASQFEQRIAQRQQALTKKRKITDDTLSEMKRTGKLVLVGTPKKKQKFTE